MDLLFLLHSYFWGGSSALLVRQSSPCVCTQHDRFTSQVSKIAIVGGCPALRRHFQCIYFTQFVSTRNAQSKRRALHECNVKVWGGEVAAADARGVSVRFNLELSKSHFCPPPVVEANFPMFSGGWKLFPRLRRRIQENSYLHAHTQLRLNTLAAVVFLYTHSLKWRWKLFAFIKVAIFPGLAPRWSCYIHFVSFAPARGVPVFLFLAEIVRLREAFMRSGPGRR